MVTEPAGQSTGGQSLGLGLLSTGSIAPPHLDTVQINEFLVTTAGPPRAAQPFPVRGLPGRGRGRLPAASLPLPGRARPSHNRDRSEPGRAPWTSGCSEPWGGSACSPRHGGASARAWCCCGACPAPGRARWPGKGWEGGWCRDSCLGSFRVPLGFL